MTTRNDSFKSLTHKLEGEGRSAHYAKAIAGKVAKEKGDIGKKDAQEKGDPWSDQNTRHDASETSGGRTISNKTIRRHAASLRDIAQHPGPDNPKSTKTSNTRETRREAALNHLEAAASTNRDDALEGPAHTHMSSFKTQSQRNHALKYNRGAAAKFSEMADEEAFTPDRQEFRSQSRGYARRAKKIEALTNRDDDLDPDRIKHDLDTDRHEDADRAIEKSIERHAAKRSDEEPDMTGHDDLTGRIQALRDELDELESQLHDGDDACDDAESEAERSAAGKVARRHQLETERDDAMSHAEHVRIGKESHRNDEDEHDAGEELAEGHEDVEHGDKAEGEELEHEAGEAEAEDRDHGGDDDDGDDDDGDVDDGDDDDGDVDDGDGDVREHRGDQAPEDVAESVTEADAQSNRRSVGVKRSFNNRHDSNEDNDMTQRSDEDIRRRIDVLDARLKRATRSASYKERDELSRIRARCDSVAQALGVRPEAPLPGEFPDEYRRRCAALLQPFSQSTKGVSIGRLDDAAFKVVEDRIYADAQSAAREPIKSLAGRLVPVESHDAAGRTITKYYGDPKAWMRPYMAPGVHIRFADSATRRNTGAR